MSLLTFWPSPPSPEGFSPRLRGAEEWLILSSLDCRKEWLGLFMAHCMGTINGSSCIAAALWLPCVGLVGFEEGWKFGLQIATLFFQP